jgi:hypothetical protein
VTEPTVDDERRDEEAWATQRRGQRRLSLEERFRQNDSISCFRAEVIRVPKDETIFRELRELRGSPTP